MIVLDFDGTIVDVWKRYHKIFCEGLVNRTLEPTLEDYRKLKRKLKRDGDIAKVIGSNLVPGYFEIKKIKLESKEYLALDSALLDEKSINIIATHQTSFIILSARRMPDLLQWEIDRLGIPIPHCQLHVVSPDEKESKAEWLRVHGTYVDCVIGDSASELHALPNLNVRRIFVDTGLFCYEDVLNAGVKIAYKSEINSAIEQCIGFMRTHCC